MSKWLKLITIMVALIALGVGITLSKFYFNTKSPENSIAGTIFSPPQAIAQFSLIDSKGRPFNNESLWGHWTFMFFGFTQCTQICPPTLTNLNKIYDILLQQQRKPIPQIVFVSIDPEHDTLDKLGKYVSGFNSHFQGATGDKTQLDKLAASLNVLYIQTKGKNKEMTIDHSGAILLLDPAGKLAAVFSSPHDPAKIAQDFQTIVAHSG